MRKLVMAWAVLGMLAACSSDGAGGGPDAAGPGADARAQMDPDAGPNYSDADWLFEPDRLVNVEIEIPQADWDAIRFQTRVILDIFGETCMDEPAGSPFTYMPATVTVEGQRFEQVGLRKKGFLGSLDDNKPSLKIKFDEYELGQSLTGLTRMTLNNSKQDPSYMNQCLGYQMFAKAGVPTPRCNFATVSVNGTPLGVYVHIESVKKPFLAQHFASNDGNLYEGTLSDFRTDWHATFERKTNKSMPPGTEDRADIQAVIDALALPDAQMVPALEALIDIESFFSFWAIESIVGHGDGYTGNNNNYFIYGEPGTGKFTFMPWGTDGLFRSPGYTPAQTRSVISNRLYLHPPTRQRYLARYGEILDTVWDDNEVHAEINRIEALISSSIPAGQESQDFTQALVALGSNITGREDRLRMGLANAGPGDAQPPSAPLCFDDVGPLTASFSIPFGGSAPITLAITINNTPITLSAETGYVGADDQNPSRSVVYMTAKDPANRSVTAIVTLPNSMVGSGTVELGTADVEALVFFVPAGQQDADAIYFMSGTMTLTAGTPSMGSTWQGSIAARMWDPPWF